MRLGSIGLLLFGVVIGSTGCAMDATTPLAPTAAARDLGTASRAERGKAERSRPTNGSEGATSSTYVVTIDPQHANVLHFGDYTLEIPGNAICTAESGYGLDVFDTDCRAERDPVRIAAIVGRLADGTPRIDLMPEMRFNPKRVVMLSLSMGASPMPSLIPRILYCPSAAPTSCVDEAQLDPTLATFVDVASRTVYRRIKHFSGYYVEW